MNKDLETAVLVAFVWKEIFEGKLQELREIREEELNESIR